MNKFKYYLIEKIARAWYGSIKSQTGRGGGGGVSEGRWVNVDGGGGGVSKSAWGMHPPGPPRRASFTPKDHMRNNPIKYST